MPTTLRCRRCSPHLLALSPLLPHLLAPSPPLLPSPPSLPPPLLHHRLSSLLRHGLVSSVIAPPTILNSVLNHPLHLCKSTLLGALSRAKPIVGHYAFTTLRPNLGNLNYDDLSITMADIPGLIKGAHENRGLGHAFLRHIERTKVLAYVVDLAAGTGGRKGVPPWEQLRDLMVELEFYSEGLSSRPCLVVANKIDEAGCDEVYEELRRRVTGVPIFPVCAVLDEGIPELKDGLKLLVNGGELCGLSLERLLVD